MSFCNLVVAIPILVGLSSAVAADQADFQNAAIKAFVQNCVLGAPDFKKADSGFRRLGFPILDPEAQDFLEIKVDGPTTWAILGPVKSPADGKVCGIIVRNSDPLAIAASVKKYADAPDFPYKGRRAGLKYLDPGNPAWLAREYPLPDQRMLIFLVTSQNTFIGALAFGRCPDHGEHFRDKT